MMTDTRIYHEAEAWIREHGLPPMFGGRRFGKREIQVGLKKDGRPALHEFDAVAEDGTVVVSIKCGGGRTAGGRAPTGQTRDAYKEVYFLSRTRAERRILVFGDEELYRVFEKESDGKRPDGVELLHVRLPAAMWTRLLTIRKKAVAEVTPKPDGPKLSDRA